MQKLEIMPIGLKVSFKIDMVNYNRKIIKANLLTVKKLIIAAVGPIVNLSFIVVFIILGIGEILIYVNILIFIFNIILIYPLDGGRILKYILHIFCGKEMALKITNIISNLFAMLITILTIYMSVSLKNFTYIFVVIYVWIIVLKENKIYIMKVKMYKILKNYVAINKD